MKYYMENGLGWGFLQLVSKWNVSLLVQLLITSKKTRQWFDTEETRIHAFLCIIDQIASSRWQFSCRFFNLHEAKVVVEIISRSTSPKRVTCRDPTGDTGNLPKMKWRREDGGFVKSFMAKNLRLNDRKMG